MAIVSKTLLSTGVPSDKFMVILWAIWKTKPRAWVSLNIDKWFNFLDDFTDNLIWVQKWG